MSAIPTLSRTLNKVVYQGPYSKDWAAAINHVIPGPDRKRRQGSWIFEDYWYRAVYEITQYYFGYFADLVDDEKIRAERDPSWWGRWQQYLGMTKRRLFVDSQNSNRSSARSRLFVTDDAPREVIVGAYRALVKIHHPDAGGDEEQFKTIDAAYKEVMREFDKDHTG